MKRLMLLFALALCAGRFCAQDIPQYCLENDSVNHYLNDFSYDTIPDLNVSYIIQYYNKDASFRSDWPKPVGLSWTAEAGSESQYIELSEDESFPDSYVINVSPDSCQYDIYNLIPGRTYYYRVISVKGDDAAQIAHGAFETTGFLRMLRADGTLNVRDMGGWKGLGGHSIRYGQLFRGARLKENGSSDAIVTEKGIAYLRDAGIRAELDLRSESNVPSGVSALAVKDENGKYDVDFKLVAKSVNARMLHFDANEANIVEIQWIINELKAGKPVYYHCSMGADRTGTLGFLLGALFGMSDGDLAKDYEITTFCSWYTGENSYDTPFARFRNYTGKWGSPDNNANTKEEYMFAPVIDKLKTMSGNTTQRKIYDFLKKGVTGSDGKAYKITEDDLDWLIDFMVDYKMVKKLTVKPNTSQSLTVGGQVQLTATFTPVDATDSTVVFRSLNDAVATVTQDGLVTAVGAGSTYIYTSIDGLAKSTKIMVTDSGTVVQDISNDDADDKMYNAAGQQIYAPAGFFIRGGRKYISK